MRNLSSLVQSASNVSEYNVVRMCYELQHQEAYTVSPESLESPSPPHPSDDTRGDGVSNASETTNAPATASAQGSTHERAQGSDQNSAKNSAAISAEDVSTVTSATECNAACSAECGGNDPERGTQLCGQSAGDAANAVLGEKMEAVTLGQCGAGKDARKGAHLSPGTFGSWIMLPYYR